jgi:hypothetical protein
VLKVRVEGLELTPPEWRGVNESLEIVGRALGGDLLAVVMQDASGIYLTFRSGAERQIAARLEAVDWRAIRVMIEEHYP